MSKARKDLGKRQNGLWSRFKDWALGELPPDVKKGLAAYGTNIDEWPAEYDDTVLSGDRYVNGQCCRTVGELKAAEADRKWESWDW